jgi:hypothetical protein
MIVMIFHIFKKKYCGKRLQDFSLHMLKFIVNSNCNRGLGKRSILQFRFYQRKMEKQNATMRISRSNSVHVQKKSTWGWKWSLQSICTRISLMQSVRNMKKCCESILIIRNIHFSGKRDGSDFTETRHHNFAEHNLCKQHIFDYRRN